jgi:hypothetical protein
MPSALSPRPRPGAVTTAAALAMTGGGGAIFAAAALLGDAEVSGWAQAAGQAILGAGAFGSAWINLQMGRDRLKFDANQIKLEAKVQQLEVAREFDARVITDQRAEIESLREAVHRVGGEVRQVRSKVKEVERRAASHHPEDGPSPTGGSSHEHPPLPPDGVERRAP